MKLKLLALFFVLCLSPIITHATVTKTLEVEFAFSDSSNEQLLGYKLYKEGTKVCQTTDPSASKITCNISTNTGTYNFALTAYYANGSESPSSPSFPFTITATASTAPTAVVSSSTSAGKAPLAVSFDGSSSTTKYPPIVSYTWSFGDGSQATGKTTSHSFKTAGTYYTKLTVKDNNGLTSSVTTPIIVTSTSQTNQESEAGTPNLPPSAFNVEVGEVSIDHNWVKVLFDSTFNQPIVVAGPPTANGSDPVLVRIRNIDQRGFEVRLQEWDYLDGNHMEETFSYLVMEKGSFVLNNGTKVEAGSFSGSSSFTKINLQQPYNSTPIILSQVISENATAAVTGRIANVNQISFEYMQQEQEKNSTAHMAETIGYIAWGTGRGEINNMVFEAGTTPDSIDDAWNEISFITQFPDLPLFIAGMQKTDGSDPAALRMQNLSRTKTQIKVEEEKSSDSETGHTSEVVGYLTIGSKTVGTTPTPTQPPADNSETQYNDFTSLPWTLHYVNSEETDREDGAAVNASDGDPSTIWHTTWSSNVSSYPHEIQLDLGATYVVNGIRYLPRQDGSINGTIAKYSVYASKDGSNWGNAIAQGTFAKDTTEKEVFFAATSARYLRFVALSEINGKTWASMAELNVLSTESTRVENPTQLETGTPVLSLHYTDSEETDRENGAAINAIDGDPSTIWHTEWSSSKPSCPHEIQINLGGTYAISGLRYLPRQDGSINGIVAKYAVYVSADGKTWGSAVAQGTFAKDTTEKTINFSAQNAQYVRFVALSEINGGPWTSMAELSVMY